jgi:hypothetical protein
MKIYLILILSIFFIGCSTKNLTPVNTSDYFWEAQKEKNYSDVRKFVKKSDKEDLKLQGSIKIKRFSLGEESISESGKMARVPTKMYLEGFFTNDDKDDVELNFDTVLAKESDGWKVNLKETRKILYLETIKKFGSGVGSGIFGKIKERLGDLEEFQNAFKDVLKNMAESVKKGH